MTPKKEERIRKKIKRIKAALAADKKHWGGYYHDGQGLRYVPTKLYIQLNDFKGGLRYVNWFKKNFPDDSGYPDFLFEWTIILFKRKRVKEAEQMAFRTFMKNTYLFDKFFKRPINKIEKLECSNLEGTEYASDYFDYSKKQEDLMDFAEWLDKLNKTEKFKALENKYIEIHSLLNKEDDSEVRGKLLKQADQLINQI